MWLRAKGFEIASDDCYIAPDYSVGQAFLPAEQTDSGKRERSPYTSSLTGAAAPPLPFSPAGRDARASGSEGEGVGLGEGRVRAEQAPTPSAGIEDPKLVSIIEQRKPKHIIIGIGGGMQDKLGSYLKHQLTYRRGIYCIGAAPGFVTGDQIVIPMWADRFFVGWIFRIIGRPRDYLTRYWKARLLPLLILKYGTRIPQLRTSS